MAEVFIVGAQRAGSTYLYEMLDAHPEILMAKPRRPEPKYFLDPQCNNNGSAQYENLYFAQRKDTHKYIGEKSTTYLEHGIVAERVKAFYPHARILIILREPALRAYSNYRFSVENGIENLSFEAALDAEAERLETANYQSSTNPFAYAERSCYVNYLAPYLEAFGSSQVKILINEEFVADLNAIKVLYAWLGIDSSFVPTAYEQRVNASATELPAPPERLSMLRMQFRTSISALEELLGREILAWRMP